jgi:RNA polymerase sigma-70 factor (ECF subfamily)
MCFQASRLKARLNDKGNIILLKYQDRSKWYKPLIRKGLYFLEQSEDDLANTSAYHLEAAIASLHASAPSFEATDWKSIYSLYKSLYRLNQTPIVALNKAIAAAYAINKETALAQLLDINDLELYHLYHTSIGEIYFEQGKKEEAKRYFHKALSLTSSRQDQELLLEKLRKFD